MNNGREAECSRSCSKKLLNERQHPKGFCEVTPNNVDITTLMDNKTYNRDPGAEGPDVSPMSPFELGSTVLRNRRGIFLWMVIGGALAVLPVLFKKISYSSTASFMSDGGQGATAYGLAGIADRLGIQVGGGNRGQSPQFYAQLLRSRAILGPVAKDTFTVSETGRAPRVLLDILEVKGASPLQRTARGVGALDGLINLSISEKTGIMTITATTAWPSLSHALTQRLLTRLNDFNLHTRQLQAGDERRFAEDRLKQAQITLNLAEDRVLAFVQRNRSFQNSPELTVEHDRFQRNVVQQQAVVNALAQSYEVARIGEVRDTPVITVIEEPSTPTEPNPRGRTKRGVLGIFLGGLFGVLVVLGRDILRRRREESDPKVAAFFEAVDDVVRSISRFTPGRALTKQG